MSFRMATTPTEPKIPAIWEKWCTTGNPKWRGKRKRAAVRRCLKSGHVRGYFSDLVIRPDLPSEDAMAPSVEHLVDPNNHDEIVVETRVINDMRSILNEQEFWQVIEHLFAVGLQKGTIKPPFGKRLPKGWSPKRHYKKLSPVAAVVAQPAAPATGR